MEISTTLFEKVKNTKYFTVYSGRGIQKKISGKFIAKNKTEESSTQQKVVEFLVTAQNSVNKFVS